ncbi:MAG: ABC transporter ATP-binding protein [Anaerolineae bacterium]|nr:ABC transporter ATP-binding protein [Anaerolineae bacterium]
MTSYKQEKDLTLIAWPISRLGEGIAALAHKSGLSGQIPAVPSNIPVTLEDAGIESWGRWLEAVVSPLGLEVEPVSLLYTEVSRFIRRSGPALLYLPGDDGPRFLAVLKSTRRYAYLLALDMNVHRVEVELIRSVLCQELETPLLPVVGQILEDAGVPDFRRPSAQAAILREQLSMSQIQGGWLLRLSPGANLWQQMRCSRLHRPLLVLLGANIAQQMLQLLAWWVVGRGTLSGYFDWAWLWAWALILLTAIPFQMLMTNAQSTFSIGTGGLFKQRLLYGILQLDPVQIRHQGAGQFLGRVMESEAVELLALGGGLTAILAVVQLTVAACVLVLGAGGWWHVLLLLLWTLVSLFLSWRYYRHSRSWTVAYRDMTNDLVERMVGHRTRLAQEDYEHWHDAEDQALDRYLKLSEKLDRIGIQLNAFIPRGWITLGLLGISYVFLLEPDSWAALAISLGGVMLASQALNSLVLGTQSVVGALTAWKQVTPIFQAAASPSAPQSLDYVLASEFRPQVGNKGQTVAGARPLLIARELDFRYRDYGHTVLKSCNLHIREGECLLVEGPSGGGKSTLASILAGLRSANSGLLLLWGFDQQTLGLPEWRRRVVVAPQFHENHVFTETFAFNLLMGRQWPPTPQDLADAEVICRELGLGDLLDRMPSGFQQMVGESGWRLSHGERSRLYIARALLQPADLIVLDESFGALDPENLYLALRCVLNRAPTLLVIAHP